jgi:hypothetical protein
MAAQEFELCLRRIQLFKSFQRSGSTNDSFEVDRGVSLAPDERRQLDAVHVRVLVKQDAVLGRVVSREREGLGLRDLVALVVFLHEELGRDHRLDERGEPVVDSVENGAGELAWDHISRVEDMVSHERNWSSHALPTIGKISGWHREIHALEDIAWDWRGRTMLVWRGNGRHCEHFLATEEEEVYIEMRDRPEAYAIFLG